MFKSNIHRFFWKKHIEDDIYKEISQGLGQISISKTILYIYNLIIFR